MLIAEQSSAQFKIEIHQVSKDAFEVKRYWISLHGVDLVLKNLWVFDNLEKAKEMTNLMLN